MTTHTLTWDTDRGGFPHAQIATTPALACPGPHRRRRQARPLAALAAAVLAPGYLHRHRAGECPLRGGPAPPGHDRRPLGTLSRRWRLSALRRNRVKVARATS